MTTRSTTLNAIQGLRAIAALLVLLFHIGIVDGKYGDGSVMPESLRFGDAGVDLFFVISGFIIGTMLMHQTPSPRKAAQFLARRIFRIVPLYWVYTTLVIVAMAVLPGEVNRSYEGQSAVKSYFLIPQQSLPTLTVGWTLVHEAYFYLVMSLLLAASPIRARTAWLITWALSTLAIWFLIEPSTPVARLIAHPMTLEFMTGIALSMLVRRVPRSLSPFLAWAGALGLALGMGWLAQLNEASTPTLYRVVVFGSASACLVLGLTRWETAFGQIFPSWLTAIGDSSFSLYLSHVFVISAIARMWHAAGLYGTGGGHAGFIVTAACGSVLAGLMSYKLVEIPLLAVTQRAPGGACFPPRKKRPCIDTQIKH